MVPSVLLAVGNEYHYRFGFVCLNHIHLIVLLCVRCAVLFFPVLLLELLHLHLRLSRVRRRWAAVTVTRSLAIAIRNSKNPS